MQNERQHIFLHEHRNAGSRSSDLGGLNENLLGNARSVPGLQSASQLLVGELVAFPFTPSVVWRECLLCSFQDKLYQEEYQFVSTEEEREEILKKLSEASNWMEEEGYAAATKVLLCGVEIPVCYNWQRNHHMGWQSIDPSWIFIT